MNICDGQHICEINGTPPTILVGTKTKYNEEIGKLYVLTVTSLERYVLIIDGSVYELTKLTNMLTFFASGLVFGASVSALVS